MTRKKRCPRCGGVLKDGKCQVCLWPAELCPTCEGKGVKSALVGGICPVCGASLPGNQNIRFVDTDSRCGGFGVVCKAIVNEWGGWHAGVMLKHSLSMGRLVQKGISISELKSRMEGIAFEARVLRFLSDNGFRGAPACLAAGRVPEHYDKLDWSGPWYVMSVASGEPFKAWMDRTRGGGFDFRVHGRALVALCESLSTFHQMGAIHRDFKPENIFWDESLGKITLIDFGSALIPGEVNPVEYIQAAFSPLWVHRDLILSNPLLSGVDRGSDIYAFGAIFCAVALAIPNIENYDVRKPDSMARLRSNLAIVVGDDIAGMVVDGMLAGYASAPADILARFLAMIKTEWGM